MRCLITGDKGFVGRHLRALLESQGHEVFGYDLQTGQDLRNYEQMRNFLDEVRPSKIFHLAGLAYVPESTANPLRAFECNLIGTTNLLEAVRQLGIVTKIQMAGTSEEYGDAGPNEDDVLNPLSPYAISKMAMDYMGRLYTRAYKIPVVITRAFNHAGPGRGEMYAESSWGKQIVEIELGRREYIEHGNLETVRNYTDVRDIVRAYTLAIDLLPGVYNVCSPNSVKMQEVMDLLVKNAKCPIETRVNQALYRPSDFSFKHPSAEKFSELTNWEPTIPLEKTMQDILNDWRGRL